MNTGTYAPRSSKLSIPLSSFEKNALASLELYDFDAGKRIQKDFGLLAMAKTAFTSAFIELHNRANSTWKGTDERSSLLKRVKLTVRLAGIYLALKNGALSRLVPGRPAGYNLDSLDWRLPIATKDRRQRSNDADRTHRSDTPHSA